MSVSLDVVVERLAALEKRQDKFETVVASQLDKVAMDSHARDAEISAKVDKIPEATAQLLKAYVSHERFKPVELVSYGLVTCTLASVMVALLSFVVKKSG